MALTDIHKSTCLHDIWQNFFNLMEDNVTSVTLADATTSTIQTRSSTFPDRIIDAKGDYPVLIVNSPKINWNLFTLLKKYYTGTIILEIFTTKSESADKFLMKMIDTVETNKANLRAIKLQNLNLDYTSEDTFFRGKIKVHARSATISFKYVFTSTRAW